MNNSDAGGNSDCDGGSGSSNGDVIVMMPIVM